MTDEEYYITLKLLLEHLVYPTLSFNGEGNDKNDKNGINKNKNANIKSMDNLSNKISIWHLFYTNKEQDNDELFCKNCKTRQSFGTLQSRGKNNNSFGLVGGIGSVGCVAGSTA